MGKKPHFSLPNTLLTTNYSLSLSPPFIVSQQLASYASHEPVETVEYVCFVVEFIALFMHADLSATI